MFATMVDDTIGEAFARQAHGVALRGGDIRGDGPVIDDITRQVLNDHTEADWRCTVTHGRDPSPAKPVLQLRASGQRPAQRDLVGVVQITADG